jgi:predicted amidohydrolase
MNTERIRVASLQYFIRPVQSFVQFADQVSALVDTAMGYQCQLLVFPEYFTCQLLTLGDVKRPMDAQIRELALQGPRVIELLAELSRRSGIYIVGGTVPTMDERGGSIYNDAYVFAPDGNYAFQGKLHMTRFENEEWLVSPRSDLRVFETEFGRIAVAICYDVEFPEIVRAAAREDAHILVVPSCTDDRQGYLRVRYCAQARAIENQMYVIHSSLVGSLPMVPAVSLNYGIAGIFTPSDYSFARDGILAEGMANQESMVVGELNMKTIVDCRSTGTVLPLVDSVRSAEIASRVEVVRL